MMTRQWSSDIHNNCYAKLLAIWLNTNYYYFFFFSGRTRFFFMMVQVMSTAASTQMMAVSINVTGIPTPRPT